MVHTQNGPSSISVPNFMRIDLLVQKLLRGPNIVKLGQVTQAMPTLGSFCIPYAGWVRPPSLYQIWSG